MKRLVLNLPPDTVTRSWKTSKINSTYKEFNTSDKKDKEDKVTQRDDNDSSSSVRRQGNTIVVGSDISSKKQQEKNISEGSGGGRTGASGDERGNSGGGRGNSVSGSDSEEGDWISQPFKGGNKDSSSGDGFLTIYNQKVMNKVESLTINLENVKTDVSEIKSLLKQSIQENTLQITELRKILINPTKELDEERGVYAL